MGPSCLCMVCLFCSNLLNLCCLQHQNVCSFFFSWSVFCCGVILTISSMHTLKSFDLVIQILACQVLGISTFSWFYDGLTHQEALLSSVNRRTGNSENAFLIRGCSSEMKRIAWNVVAVCMPEIHQTFFFHIQVICFLFLPFFTI